LEAKQMLREAVKKLKLVQALQRAAVRLMEAEGTLLIAGHSSIQGNSGYDTRKTCGSTASSSTMCATGVGSVLRTCED
jgi:hypothetical protein